MKRSSQLVVRSTGVRSVIVVGVASFVVIFCLNRGPLGADDGVAAPVDVGSGDVGSGENGGASKSPIKSSAATEPNVERSVKASRPGRGPLPTYTPEREAAALTFVASHHAELSPLLAYLKSSRPNEYQKAVRKLFSDSERLAYSRELQPRRYELELQEWKLQSRAELLVARLTMGSTPKLEADLRRVLAEQMEVQRELLILDRERLAQRAAVIDREINRLVEQQEATLEERFKRALSSVGQKNQPLKNDKTPKAAGLDPSDSAKP